MENKRVLLVEDNKTQQKLVESRLSLEGYQVDVVDNGHQGFIIASSNSYDVIISDIIMPHWDGFKFIEAVQVACPNLPIVIISSSLDRPEITKRLQGYTNVVKVLRKPIDFGVLLETLSPLPSQSHVRLDKMARIVATIGPSSADSTTLGKMILAGMDVARLNFSHGTHESHHKTLLAIREAEEQWEKPIAVLVDLSGPKIRTGKMVDDCIELRPEEQIIIQAEPTIGIPERISTIMPEILPDLKKGDTILLDDGLLELRVKEPGTSEVICEITVGGILQSNKGMNLPETELSVPSVTDKDWLDLDWALNHSIDYVALSFVRTAAEIREIQNYIAASQNPELRVIAKIEKPEAITNIGEIIEAADAIMIARGDMGVELPAARVPRIQQRIINLCWEANTPVITATQMLDSMATNIRPTRAEVTDVSVAIFEGTDGVMLSKETATGIDPVNVVRTMASIICEEESYTKLTVDKYQKLVEETSLNPALTAVASLHTTRATILFDPDGTLYPALSKWNRKVVSIMITKSIQVARHASLYNNIVPLIIEDQNNRAELVSKVISRVREEGYIKQGDMVAIVEGKFTSSSGIQQIGTLQLIEV